MPGTCHSPIASLVRPHTSHVKAASCKPDMLASGLCEGLFNTVPIWHPVVRPAAARRVRLLDEPESRQEAEPRSPLEPARSLGHFLEDPSAGEAAAGTLRYPSCTTRGPEHWEPLTMLMSEARHSWSRIAGFHETRVYSLFASQSIYSRDWRNSGKIASL